MTGFITWVLFIGSMAFLNTVGFGWLALYLTVGAVVVSGLFILDARMILGSEWKELPFKMRNSWLFRFGITALSRNIGKVIFWPLFVVLFIIGAVISANKKKNDSEWAYKSRLMSFSAASAVHENSLIMWRAVIKADIPTLLENNFYYGKNQVFTGKGMALI